VVHLSLAERPTRRVNSHTPMPFYFCEPQNRVLPAVFRFVCLSHPAAAEHLCTICFAAGHITQTDNSLVVFYHLAAVCFVMQPLSHRESCSCFVKRPNAHVCLLKFNACGATFCAVSQNIKFHNFVYFLVCVLKIGLHMYTIHL